MFFHMKGARYLPPTCYPWLFVRHRLLVLCKSWHDWNGLKQHLSVSVRHCLPKRYRKPQAWSRFLKRIKRCYEVLLNRKKRLVRIKTSPIGGLGLFARKRLKRGILKGVRGWLHRVSSKQVNRIQERYREASIVIGNEGESYIMSGPASLLNHSCQHYNAELCFDDAYKPVGEIRLRLLKCVVPGEEICIHYGDSFWKHAQETLGLQCQCQSCA